MSEAAALAVADAAGAGGLLQISDTHFGTEQPRVMQALEDLTRAVRPDVLVLSGDVTQRATASQFAAARAFVDRLAVRTKLVIPGNHDIPLFALGTRVLAPYRRYRAEFGDDLEPVVETTGWLVVGVNTTRWYRHENGAVSPMQVERVANRLARAAPGQLRIVVVHQPVAVIDESDQSNLLGGRRRAVERWAQAGADLVLGGHIHLPFVRPLARQFGPLPRALWCVQAGTAVSTRVRDGAPNSVNVLRPAPIGGARGCVVERWDHQASSGRFERVESTALPLSDIATPGGPGASGGHEATT